MRPLVAFLAFGLSALASAAPVDGPVRVLYLDATGEEQSAVGSLHGLMAELGREAIWFDYATGAVPDAATLGRYDVLAVKVADAAPSSLPVLVVKADVTPAAFRSQLEAALPAARKAAWQKFLAQREPEVREKNGNVANYEKRPEPLTFQKPYSVKGSMERTQVPADLKLVLFAAEPDIMKPIAFAWDARGRLWVCETGDYPHGVKEDQSQGNDRIKICEDTDGDGKADKFTVFADKLNIPTSLVFANGGVVVAQAPNFVFLKDTDGDDKADVRQVILTGWGIRDTHAQTSNLSYGYDNWLRGAVGYSGFAGEIGGEKKNFAQGTYRFAADGSKLEFLHQFTNNTWGQSANAAGDAFGGTANNAPIFFGGIPATAWAKGSRGMSAKKINLVDKAHTITPNFRQVDVMGGYTAAAGANFIYSAQLPPRLQGKAMVCEPTMKLISLMDVQPAGAGYVAKDGYSLVASTDEWMSPVFAEVGPDGAIWFADWQNFIIQHNPTPSVGRGGYDAKTGVGGAHENDLRDHVRGRIYRIVWDKAGAGAGLVPDDTVDTPPDMVAEVVLMRAADAGLGVIAATADARGRVVLDDEVLPVGEPDGAVRADFGEDRGHPFVGAGDQAVSVLGDIAGAGGLHVHERDQLHRRLADHRLALQAGRELRGVDEVRAGGGGVAAHHVDLTEIRGDGMGLVDEIDLLGRHAAGALGPGRGRDAAEEDRGVVGRATESIAGRVGALAPGVIGELVQEFELRAIRREAVGTLGEVLLFAPDLTGETAVTDRTAEPVVIAIGKIARLSMRIADTPAGEDDLTDVGLVVAVGILQEDEVRGLRDDHAAVGEDEARRDVELIGEDRELVGLTVAVGVFADLDAVVALRLVFLHAVRIIASLADPEATTRVPGERDRLHDVRLGGEEHQLQVGGHLGALHAAFHGVRLLEGQRLRAFLVIGDVAVLLADFRFALREELLPGGLAGGRQSGFELGAKSGGGHVGLDDQDRQGRRSGIRDLDREDIIASERGGIGDRAGGVIEPDRLAAEFGHQPVERPDRGLLFAGGVQIQDADRAVDRGCGSQGGETEREESDEGTHRGMGKDNPRDRTWQHVGTAKSGESRPPRRGRCRKNKRCPPPRPAGTKKRRPIGRRVRGAIAQRPQWS